MRIKALDEYTIEVRGEKHTLLNMILHCIREYETEQKIELVGYTIPHPMEDKAIVKIQLQHSEQTKEQILGVYRRGIVSAIKIVESTQAAWNK